MSDDIMSIEECLNHDLLAWVSYPPNPGERACFVFPRYLVRSSGLVRIDPSAFPELGSLVAIIVSAHSTVTYDAEAIRNRYGSIVVMRLNSGHAEINREYEQGTSPNKYSGLINPSLAPGKSMLEFTKMSNHTLSKALVQVVEAPAAAGDWSQRDSMTMVVPGEVMTELVALAFHTDRGELIVGPFQCRRAGDAQTVELGGAPDYDYRIYEFTRPLSDTTHGLADRDGIVRAEFLDRAAIDRFVDEKRFTHRYDWVPRQLLVKVMQRALSTSDVLRDLSKTKMRKLRQEVSSISDEAAELKLDDARRQKVLELVGDVEYFGQLPDQLQDSILDRMSDQKLSEIVLKPQNLPRFQKQILSIPEISSEVEKERAALSASLDSLRAEKKRAQDDLASTKDQLKEAQRSLDERLHTAEKAKSAELARLEEECRKRESELTSAEERLQAAKADEEVVRQSVDALMQKLESKVGLASDALESEIVQRALAQASGWNVAGEQDSPAEASIKVPQLVLAHDEGTKLVDRLFDIVCEGSGRDYSKNELIDFYICLAQGYITTFAGLPGTGKTSLCRLLAEGLGLGDEGLGRFVEVSVERGWTSYRDYVGYYNPLTRAEERSNPEVFSLFERLGKEDGADPASVAPGIVLLDEANLSPIEHYWAPFLKACDSFQTRTLKLPIGGNRSLAVPRNARFLATVNYDHTTEELSPRFLDRSWVIMLNPDTVVETDEAQDEAAPVQGSPQGAVSYAAFVRTFGRRRYPKTDAASESILSDVLQACAANGHPVSPRSQGMIRGFVSAASELMDTSTAATQYDPIDFAVAQKILPSISGPRETQGDLLDALAKACSQLTNSAALIQNMKAKGEASGYYQFFA